MERTRQEQRLVGGGETLSYITRGENCEAGQSLTFSSYFVDLLHRCINEFCHEKWYWRGMLDRSLFFLITRPGGESLKRVLLHQE